MSVMFFMVDGCFGNEAVIGWEEISLNFDKLTYDHGIDTLTLSNKNEVPDRL